MNNVNCPKAQFPYLRPFASSEERCRFYCVVKKSTFLQDGERSSKPRQRIKNCAINNPAAKRTAYFLSLICNMTHYQFHFAHVICLIWLLLTISCVHPVSATSDSSPPLLLDVERSRSGSIFKEHYTNSWTVKIEGSEADASAIAERRGFVNLGEVIPNSGYFLFSTDRVQRRSKRRTGRTIRAHLDLSLEPQVKWLRQEVAKKRVKRAFRAYRSAPNDPQWPDMWYLNRGPGLDMGVQKAWEMGITGKNTVVTILDDGLEFTHPDIRGNYDPLASYDINDRDSDPSPRYDLSNENRHGTRCAGEVAAVFNNDVCVVGIAHNAKIGGIRMLDGDVTDAVEARALSHNKDHVDIYSASWGPDDDGRTVDGPARLAQIAFQDGILKGRGGKGSIFVWASGNGGRDADSCNCDGYTNSIYTVSVSSATENGNVPWYSEACSSTLATTYSSGSHGERMIVTTDLHSGCTSTHTGTSASAPIAAAICALALEANPNLSWRDLQHIVVGAARAGSLKASDWVLNGAGKNVSHAFGFGLMDAGQMVVLAKNWTRVPEQHRCVIPYRDAKSYTTTLQIPQRTKLQVVLETDGCKGQKGRHVVFLEHVQAKVTLTAPKRGDIQVFLISPSGTRSTLLAKRARDTSRAGFRDWAFMTTHNWGEKAAGTWTLEIQNDGWAGASLLQWDLVLYGTDQPVGAFGGGSKSMHSPGIYQIPKLFSCSSSLSILKCFWLLSITLAWYSVILVLS